MCFAPELPVEHDRLKRLQFDLSERTKLASSLSEFKKVGRVEAPESMMIHDFTAKFDFDIGPDKRLILDTVFDYGDRKVTTRKDLERLPFAFFGVFAQFFNGISATANVNVARFKMVVDVHAHFTLRQITQVSFAGYYFIVLTQVFINSFCFCW